MKSGFIKTRINLLFSVIGLLAILMSGCSTRHHSVKRGKTAENNLKAEKNIIKDAEKNLKGDAKRIIEEACEWLETPYAYGKEEKGVATDCSGMVMKIYDKILGCKLPRISYQQADYCKKINGNSVKPGDLVFFITNGGNRINHVGIMMDEIQFIHASSHGVIVSSMQSDYYKKHFRGFGRVPCFNP